MRKKFIVEKVSSLELEMEIPDHLNYDQMEALVIRECQKFPNDDCWEVESYLTMDLGRVD